MSAAGSKSPHISAGRWTRRLSPSARSCSRCPRPVAYFSEVSVLSVPANLLVSVPVSVILVCGLLLSVCVFVPGLNLVVAFPVKGARLLCAGRDPVARLPAVYDRIPQARSDARLAGLHRRAARRLLCVPPPRKAQQALPCRAVRGGDARQRPGRHVRRQGPAAAFVSGRRPGRLQRGAPGRQHRRHRLRPGLIQYCKHALFRAEGAGRVFHRHARRVPLP